MLMGSPQAQSLSQLTGTRVNPYREAKREFRHYPAKVKFFLRDFDVDDFGVARAQAAQFMAYGAGIVWIVEPLLARMISGPKATPARIPAGDPRIGPGSKCDAVRHSFPPAFCVRAKPTTEPSQSSASNPIGTEKRHSVTVSCAGPRAGEGAEQVTIAVRRLRTATGWPGKAPTIAGLRVSLTAALYWTAWSEAAEAGVIRS
jgi:hypothetical protein